MERSGFHPAGKLPQSNDSGTNAAKEMMRKPSRHQRGDSLQNRSIRPASGTVNPNEPDKAA